MNRSKLLLFATMFCLVVSVACDRDEERDDTAATDTAAPTDTSMDTTASAPEPTSAAGPATATLQGAPGDTDFSGTVTITPDGAGVRVVAHFEGVDTDGMHGIHVHENGQCEHGGDKHFTSAGGHFNPTGTEHACPPTDPRHAGDLGNIEITQGVGHVEMITTGLSLSGPNSVVGKAIILHTGEDDCKTQPTGNSGDRLACGVVNMGGNAQ
ncbi:MAG TPA: superoxide dismutase family protein [Thermoanaerobaculia bacterium]